MYDFTTTLKMAWLERNDDPKCSYWDKNENSILVLSARSYKNVTTGKITVTTSKTEIYGRYNEEVKPMQFQLTINCDNAAFSDDAYSAPANGQELARILRELADKIESFDDVTDFEQVLYDVNGNRVGEASVSA